MPKYMHLSKLIDLKKCSFHRVYILPLKKTVNNIEFRESVLIPVTYFEMHQKIRWVDGW